MFIIFIRWCPRYRGDCSARPKYQITLKTSEQKIHSIANCKSQTQPFTPSQI